MKGRRAFAIAIVLFLVVILMMLSGVLVERVRFGARFQLEGRDEAQAMWAAQSGINYAMAQWSADRSWSANVLNHALPGSDATFSIQFSPSASVNNLNKQVPADSELGPATVPADRAYLVVDGQANGQTQRLCAIVGPGSVNTLAVAANAVLATGDISLDGFINIRGQRSTDDASPIDANLVSTSSTSVIQATSGSVQVNGRVQSNGPSGSILPANLSATKGFTYNAGGSPPADPDIPGRVASKSSAITPVLTPGATVLPAGDFYFPSGLNYDGDLSLGSSNLYVNGPINITGSISGRGSVFANGKGTLTGSADITAADPMGLGIYVQGDLNLNGLDAQKYLSTLATQTGNSVPLANANTVFAEMKKAITAVGGTSDGSLLYPNTKPSTRRFSNPGGLGGGKSSDFDAMTDLLGHGADDFVAGTTLGGTYTPGPANSNPLGTLRSMVQADTSPANATQAAFVMKRLNQLFDPADPFAGFLGWHATNAQYNTDLANTLNTGGITRLADALNDGWEDPAITGNTTLAPNMNRLRNRASTALDSLADRLGTASIRGTVYCRGNLTCDHDLVVIGSILAAGPNSKISLRNTQLTFIQETAAQAGSSTGAMSVRAWYRR
jgi:hypothetical protein